MSLAIAGLYLYPDSAESVQALDSRAAVAILDL
jgi:hypothetical protein